MQSPPLVLAIFQNVGITEILFILLIIVLLFGVNKIPQIARSLGKAQREFTRARQEVEEEVTAAPGDSEDERIRKAARQLGIPTEDKTTAELKDAIAQKMGSPSPPSS